MSRVCPWWLGYLLANPIRKLIHDPEEILRSYVAHGMTVADIGSGMGYFSLPMAVLVGNKGKVVCVDLQEKMLSSLIKRAQKAGVLDRIVTRRAQKDSLNMEDMAGSADFVLAFAVVHEVPDQERILQEIHRLLKQNGCLLISEPKGARYPAGIFTDNFARIRPWVSRRPPRPVFGENTRWFWQKLQAFEPCRGNGVPGTVSLWFAIIENSI